MVELTSLPVALSDASVSFDGGGLSLPGHIHFVSPGQINVQIPWEFQGQTSVAMKVTVSALPSTLMLSGSSVASKSARATARPGNPSEGTVTRTTRRLAVRPVNCPSS